MPCCRCNRTGSCKGCSCVNAGIPCTSCLPSRLGSCANNSSSSSCVQRPSVESTLINAPPTTDLPTTADAVVRTTIPGVSDTQQPPPLDERQVRSNTDTSILPLPSFTPADNQLSIGEFDFDSSSQIINAAYEEIVHFIPNLFPVPSGSIGSQFVNIIAQLFQCFGDVARGEGIAIKTAMVATQLLLQ